MADQTQDNLDYLEDAGDEAVLPAGNDDSLPAEDTTTQISATSDDATPVQDDPSLASPVATAAGQDSMSAVQAIIVRQSSRLDELKDQMKKLNESMRSIFDNDQALAQAEEQAKESSKVQKERKQQLNQSAEAMQLKYKIGEIRDQVKDLEESLNNHLLNYYQITGSKFFDTEMGEQREFAVRAKLLGKKKQIDDQ